MPNQTYIPYTCPKCGYKMGEISVNPHANNIAAAGNNIEIYNPPGGNAAGAANAFINPKWELL